MLTRGWSAPARHGDGATAALRIRFHPRHAAPPPDSTRDEPTGTSRSAHLDASGVESGLGPHGPQSGRRGMLLLPSSWSLTPSVWCSWIQFWLKPSTQPAM